MRKDFIVYLLIVAFTITSIVISISTIRNNSFSTINYSSFSSYNIIGGLTFSDTIRSLENISQVVYTDCNNKCLDDFFSLNISSSNIEIEKSLLNCSVDSSLFIISLFSLNYYLSDTCFDYRIISNFKGMYLLVISKKPTSFSDINSSDFNIVYSSNFGLEKFIFDVLNIKNNTNINSFNNFHDLIDAFYNNKTDVLFAFVNNSDFYDFLELIKKFHIVDFSSFPINNDFVFHKQNPQLATFAIYNYFLYFSFVLVGKNKMESYKAYKIIKAIHSLNYHLQPDFKKSYPIPTHDGMITFEKWNDYF